MQDMDTLAPPESNDLEVLYDSTTHATGLQLRTEDVLYSRGGSAPVELGDSSDTDDEEQAHGKGEVEVIVATPSEPTATEVADADTAATSSWPPGQPRPNDMFNQIKFDAVFDAVSNDVRMGGEAAQGLGHQEEGEAEEGEDEEGSGLCDPQEVHIFTPKGWFNPNPSPPSNSSSRTSS
jgi:hypothetical protein